MIFQLNHLKTLSILLNSEMRKEHKVCPIETANVSNKNCEDQEANESVIGVIKPQWCNYRTRSTIFQLNSFPLVVSLWSNIKIDPEDEGIERLM